MFDTALLNPLPAADLEMLLSIAASTDLRPKHKQNRQARRAEFREWTKTGPKEQVKAALDEKLRLSQMRRGVFDTVTLYGHPITGQAGAVVLPFMQAKASLSFDRFGQVDRRPAKGVRRGK